jgi:hypothetical protein
LRAVVARWCVLSIAGAALTACGSGDGPQNSNPTALQPTFASIQANVFTPVCEQCHSGPSAPFGLRLDPANSYALLVGVASGQSPAFLRVEPNNPDDSYLIRKLEGTAGAGERMPAGLPPLPAADIAVVRQWIVDGALQGAAPAPPDDPITVTSLSPLPDSVEDMLPASIMAVFDRELDATSVTTATFVLERSGGDGTFGDGNEAAITPVSVTVPVANPMTAVMDLAGVVSAEDTYRVTLAGSGAANILDLDANALDGEFTGTFPSGDGTAGGDFEAEFEVAGIQPTLTSIQDNVFTPMCSGCHSGGGGTLPGSMNLSSANASFAALVGVASVQQATLERVEAGNPDDSYLIRKLEGGPGITGNQMPAFGTPLDQGTIDAIRLWITDGAVQ